MIGDALEGTLAVIVAQQVGLSDTVVALVALAVFLGQPTGFSGNRRAAKGSPRQLTLLALDPWLGLGVLGVWLLVAYVSRYSSLAAIVAAAAAR